MRKFLFALLPLILTISSCSLLTGKPNAATTPSTTEIASLQKGFMSSYYAERSGAPSGVAAGARALTPFNAASRSSAKATVPVTKLSSASFASLVGKTTTIAGDYPEPGQSTSFTVSAYANAANGNPIYDIKATTTFATTDSRKSYFEEYYVEDAGSSGGSGSTWSAADGSWTIADPVVKLSGGLWSQDQAARVQMILTFRDGSTRNETIVSSSLSGGPKFSAAALDVSGSLDMSSAFIPASTTDAAVLFSSVVVYYVSPSASYNYWFWSGSSQQTILGVRYYTEVADAAAGSYDCYTVSFEKTLNTLTTTGGSYTSTLKSVYAGSSFDTLAESVLRQKIVYGLSTAAGYYEPSGAGAVTTNMKTRVVNISGLKDFYLTQMNSDNVSLSSWAGSTIYVPKGEATEILAEDTGAAVFARNQQISPASGTISFTDSLGIGDVATVYASIVTGQAITTISGAPASNLNGSGVFEYSFDGSHIGYQTSNPLTANPLTSGTVEAWVYLNSMTNTAGIIHNGIKTDFTDEGYSLQLWGNSGQVAIVLNAPGGGSNNYDLVTSSKNLAAQKWYYLVATWDTATKKINFYVNGALSSSGTMKVTASGVRNDSTDVIIGSQLPKNYNGTYGYFALDGKIVGANASASAMSAATALANYNAYKGYAAGW